LQKIQKSLLVITGFAGNKKNNGWYLDIPFFMGRRKMNPGTL